MVAALERDSVAHRALVAEGVPHQEHVCEGYLGYAAVVSEAWRRGGFILLEHDIVPWVGAIQELQDCESDWCAFAHAKSGRTLRALGLNKFSDRLVSEYPYLWEEWESEPWQFLERGVLVAAARVAEVCEHSPAVGHAREPD